MTFDDTPIEDCGPDAAAAPFVDLDRDEDARLRLRAAESREHEAIRQLLLD
jgi:hypothetical protein